MANEITIRSSLRVKNGNYDSGELGGQNLKFDQTGNGGGVPGLVTATTAGVNVDLSALSTIGWAYLKNLDETNFVQVGHWDAGMATFYPIIKMKAGESAGPFRFDPACVLRLKADTASCLVQVEVMED